MCVLCVHEGMGFNFVNHVCVLCASEGVVSVGKMCAKVQEIFPVLRVCLFR